MARMVIFVGATLAILILPAGSADLTEPPTLAECIEVDDDLANFENLTDNEKINAIETGHECIDTYPLVFGGTKEVEGGNCSYYYEVWPSCSYASAWIEYLADSYCQNEIGDPPAQFSWCVYVGGYSSGKMNMPPSSAFGSMTSEELHRGTYVCNFGKGTSNPNDDGCEKTWNGYYYWCHGFHSDAQEVTTETRVWALIGNVQFAVPAGVSFDQAGPIEC